MNFEQLRIFITVVEQRSFTKAAEALYISHSTTSRNVSALEEMLGVRLLARDNRSVRLTPAGDLMYREGSKLLKKIEVIESAVQNAGQGLAGRLMIACSNLLSCEELDGYKDFCKKYPDITLSVSRQGTKSAWDQVAEGTADVGLMFAHSLPSDASGCEIRRLRRERFCAVMGSAHPLCRRSSISIEELSRSVFIHFPEIDYGFMENHEHRELISKVTEEAKPAGSMSSLMFQVLSGSGLTLLPCSMAHTLGKDYVAAEISDADMSANSVLVWRQDNLNPSMQLFVGAVLDKVKN